MNQRAAFDIQQGSGDKGIVHHEQIAFCDVLCPPEGFAGKFSAADASNFSRAAGSMPA